MSNLYKKTPRGLVSEANLQETVRAVDEGLMGINYALRNSIFKRGKVWDQIHGLVRRQREKWLLYKEVTKTDFAPTGDGTEKMEMQHKFNNVIAILVAVT